MSLRWYNPYVPAQKQGEANSIAGIPVVGVPNDRDVLQYTAEGVLTWRPCGDIAPAGATGPAGPVGPMGPQGTPYTVDTLFIFPEINPNTSITMLQRSFSIPTSISAPAVDGSSKTIVNSSIVQWNTCGEGWTGLVYALASNGADYFVGGLGGTTGGISYLAKVDANEQWTAVAPSTPLNAAVRALACVDKGAGNNFLWIGGYFTDHLAKWDYTSSSLVIVSPSSFMDDNILAICDGPGDLIYVGCDSNQTFNGSIFSFDTVTNAWSLVGTGVNHIPSSGALTQVRSVAYSPMLNKLYIGGVFTIPSSNVAAYNISTGLFEPLSGGLGGELSFVESMVLDGAYLYVGGFFSRMNVDTTNDECSNLVRCNLFTGVWEAVSSIPAPVTALTRTDTLLYAASGDNSIVSFNLATLEQSSRTNTVYSSVSPQVYDMIFSQNRIIIGGDFNGVQVEDGEFVQGISADNIAYYGNVLVQVDGSFCRGATPYSRIRFGNAGAVVMTWLNSHNAWIISSNTNVTLL